jgi:hypothetical protein
MKRFKVQQTCLVFMMLILSVFLITGCGGNGGETDKWIGPAETGGGGGGGGLGPGPAGPGPDLGAARTFGFLSSAALTNSEVSTITGDAATTSDHTAIVGFHDSTGFSIGESCPAGPCGTVTGTLYASDQPLADAGATPIAVHAAALNAYSGVGGLAPAVRPGGLDVRTNSLVGAGGLPGKLGGRTLAPGIYYSVAGGVATYDILVGDGDLTLDGQGNPDAVWVFQTQDGVGTLTVGAIGAPVNVILKPGSGAQAKNVYWYVPAGATINTGSHMVGTMISDASITFGTAGDPTITTLDGRALVLTAGATMVGTVITVPGP